MPAVCLTGFFELKSAFVEKPGVSQTLLRFMDITYDGISNPHSLHRVTSIIIKRHRNIFCNLMN